MSQVLLIVFPVKRVFPATFACLGVILWVSKVEFNWKQNQSSSVTEDEWEEQNAKAAHHMAAKKNKQSAESICK